MKTKDIFSIEFGKLKFGKHDFNFEINDEFFDSIPESLIKEGKLNTSLVFDKQEHLFKLDFEITRKQKGKFY